MQFGRIFGLALITLGIFLCVLQFVHYMTPPKSDVGPTQTETRTVPQPYGVRSSLPGIVGAGLLVAGFAFLVTARRKDEPDAKYRVK